MAFEEDVSGSLETASDAGKGKEGVVHRWMMELDLASKQEKDWRQNAEDVIQRFRADEKEDEHKPDQFNILWSNTEVMRPVLYNSTPLPDVRRRFRDEDDTGKDAAKIMERAVSSALDMFDFDHVMNLAVLDLLLPGRAVTRVRYEPTIEEVQPEPYPAEPIGMDERGIPVYADDDMDENGMVRMVQDPPFDRITDQVVYTEPVHWKDFRHGPGGNWQEVEWIAFRHLLTRDQLRERFPQKGGKVELDYTPDDMDDDKVNDMDDPHVFKRAVVWEVWHKPSRKVIWLAPSYKEAPLREDDDPLELLNFFPIPRPIYAIETSDSLVPVELFRLYKDQAKELDRLTRRINRIIEGLKVRGVYDSTLSVMGELMDADDNQMMPSRDESLALMQQAGGLDRAIWIFPIDRIASVLTVLYEQRSAVIQTIYEITGLSDILRGQSDPRETKGAQEIKAQTSSRRLRKMQREVQRYVRDLIHMMAEVISEHFQADMISAMTGEEVSGEVEQLLRNDLSRQFRIDIETDSTISADERYDQESLITLLDGISRYVGTIGPVVEQGYMTGQSAVQLLESIVRHFRLGRKIEDAFEENERQMQEGGQQQQRQDPETMKAEAEIQRQNQEFQAEQQRKQAEFQQEQQRKDAETQAEMRRKDAETEARLENERRKTEAQIEMQRAKQQRSDAA